MGDIDFRLMIPSWAGVALVGLQYWYALVPAVLALGAVAAFGRTLPTALRYAAGIAAGLIAAPYALLLVVVATDAVGQARQAAQDRARHRTLDADETVGTLRLPAGAVLAYADETHRTVSSVALPRPTRVAGILLKGALEPVTEREWAGELAQDQAIGDWPCQAGELWFTPQGAATRCTLAASHRLAGYELPAGAVSRHDPASGGWEFQLPQSGAAVSIAALGADLPPGGTLTLAADGALRRLYVPHESRMTIAGVALYDHVIVDATGLTAELAEPTPIAGALQPAATVVHVDLATGRIETAIRPSVLDP